MTDLVFFVAGFSGLVALSGVLVVIGRLAADGAETAAPARLATWIVTAGFAALGTGGIAIVGAALPLLSEGRAVGLYLAIGIVATGHGIGFYTAAGLLRSMLAAARRRPGG